MEVRQPLGWERWAALISAVATLLTALAALIAAVGGFWGGPA